MGTEKNVRSLSLTFPTERVPSGQEHFVLDHCPSSRSVTCTLYFSLPSTSAVSSPLTSVSSLTMPSSTSFLPASYLAASKQTGAKKHSGRGGQQGTCKRRQLKARHQGVGGVTYSCAPQTSLGSPPIPGRPWLWHPHTTHPAPLPSSGGQLKLQGESRNFSSLTRSYESSQHQCTDTWL